MDQLEEIKSKIDLVQFISEYLPLKKAGQNFKALCPFHSEKTPSFIVSPERQIWKCFGCGKGGDVFGFLMEYERMEFGEALRLLAKKLGIILKSYQPSESEAEKEKLYQINHLAAEFFHYLLLNHQAGKTALSYILGRGISKDSLRFFKIGYSPNLWDGLQRYLVGKKGIPAEDLAKAGLIIPSQRKDYYDRFRHRLIFPLQDHRGNVCGFAGRVLDPQVKEAKYVNTPETMIYHKSELLYPLNLTKEEVKKENRAVVVEGELDAISSFQVGVKNVVAIKGSALTEEQVKLLKRYCENLVLALDADIAGDSAARRGIEIADKAGLNLRVVEMERYKDPDEAAQKAPGFYKDKVKKAVPFYDYLIDSAFKRFPEATPEDKKKIGEEMTPVLAKIENEIVKNHYVRLLAEKLSVNEEALLMQIRKFLQTGSVARPTTSLPKTNKSRSNLLEEHFFALCLQSGKVADLVDKANKKLIEFPAHQRLIALLEDFLTEKKKFTSTDFSATLPAELTEIFNNFYLHDLGNKVDDNTWLELEIKKTQFELKTLRLKEQLIKFSGEIKMLEQAGKVNSEEWQKAREKFREVSSKLASVEEKKGV